jgi:hypothetical protein
MSDSLVQAHIVKTAQNKMSACYQVVLVSIKFDSYRRYGGLQTMVAITQIKCVA